MLINPEIKKNPKKNPNNNNNIVFIALTTMFIWKIIIKKY